MKRILLILPVFTVLQLAIAELSLEGIRTASDTVLVAYLKSTVIKADEANTSNIASWELNGGRVEAINKFVTEADACDHQVYLQIPQSIQGTAYRLETPMAQPTWCSTPSGSFANPLR